MPTRRLNSPMFFAILLLVATPFTAAQPQGEVQVESIEVSGAGHTSGTLASIFLDQFTPNQPLAKPHFKLDSTDAAITSNHAEARIGTTSARTREVLVYEGPAQILGMEIRPDFHFWVTPLDSDAVFVEIQNRACTTFEKPQTSEEFRKPTMDPDGSRIIADTSQTVAVASCTEAVAVIRGDLSITAWEWDMTINGDRVNSGVNDATRDAGLVASGVGSADELTIAARNATLTIPLTPETYELYIAHPRLEARELRLVHAKGTLPGILEPVQGQDVDLVGDYTLTVDASADAPLQARITGTTNQALTGGAPLTVQVPATPGDQSVFFLLSGFVAFLIVAFGLLRYRRPLVALRLNPSLYFDKTPRTLREKRSAGLCIMADAALKGDQPHSARRVARRAFRLDPDNARALLIQGGALLALEHTADALAAFKRSEALAKLPRLRCLAAMGEAQSLAQMGDMRRAFDVLMRARNIDPQTAARTARTDAWNRFNAQGILAMIRSGTYVGSNPDYCQ